MEIDIPKKGSVAKCSKYKDGTSKPWSQWGYGEYIAFQKNLRTKLKSTKTPIPMDWEFGAWIRGAEKIAKMELSH